MRLKFNIFERIASLKIDYRFFLFLFVTFFFFSYPVLILWDSAHYMGLVRVIEGSVAFNNWDVIRGPVFPVLIHLSNVLFGATTQGLVMFTFSFYLIALYLLRKIIEVFSKRGTYQFVFLNLLFFVIVILNPIIFGYYHALLTEFVAMTLALVSSFIAWRFLFIDFKDQKAKYIFFSLYFILAVPFSWFLKQPYVSVTLFPLLVSGIIQIFTCKNLSTLLRKFLVILFSCLSLVASIFIWEGYLDSRGIDTDTDRGTSNVLGNQLIVALENSTISEETYNINEIENVDSLNIDQIEQDIESMDTESHFRIVSITYEKSGDIITNQRIVETDPDGLISAREGLLFIGRVFLEEPLYVIKSYITNYLGLINIYTSVTEDSVGYFVRDEIQKLGCNENCAIAISVLDNKSNIYYMREDMYSNVIQYEQFIDSPMISSKLLEKNKDLSILLFNYSLLLLPFLLLFQILYLLLSYKKMSLSDKKIVFLVIILAAYGFLHILAHAVTGAVIDRYASPAYMTTLVSFVGTFCVVWTNSNLKKRIKSFLSRIELFS